MNRPAISISKQHLFYYAGVGACWFITGLLGLIDEIKAVNILIAVIDLFTVAILVYVGIGKKERNDEMSLSFYEKACAFGLQAFTCISMILIIIDIIFSGCIPFKVGGPIILGTTFMSVGWYYYQLEHAGDI